MEGHDTTGGVTTCFLKELEPEAEEVGRRRRREEESSCGSVIVVR